MAALLTAGAGAIASLGGSLAGIVNAGADTLRSGSTSVAFLATVGASVYTFFSANLKPIIFTIILIIICLIGVGGTYGTGGLINAVNAVYVCTIRPAAEIILKYPLHFIHAIQRHLFAFWNTVITYIYEACLSVLYYDISDYITYLYDSVNLIISTFATVDGPSFSSSLSTVVTRLGDVAASIWRVFEFFLETTSCVAFFWTKARPSFAIPTYTTFGVTETPAFFRVGYPVGSPTNAPPPPTPAPTPLPPPTPFPAPTPPPPTPFPDYWTGYAYEFNPRYGAYTNFFTGAPTPGTTGPKVANYFRRILVKIQVFISNIARTIFTFIRYQRTFNKSELWAGLITNTNAEESFWRQCADTASSGFSILWAFVPATGSTCTPASTSYETSEFVFGMDRIVYRLIRRMFSVPRLVSLFTYQLTTSNVGGVPLLDFVYNAFFSPGSFRINLIARDLILCEMYRSIDMDSFSSVLKYCPLWKGIDAGPCERWDGLSYAAFIDTGSPVYVAHFQEAYDTIVLGLFEGVNDILEVFGRIWSLPCGTSTDLYDAWNDHVIPFVQTVGFIVADFPARLSFFPVATTCAQTQGVGFLIVPIQTKFFGYFVFDYVLGTMYPSIVYRLAGIPCVEGQNIFTCLVTQAAIGTPTDFIEIFCEGVKFIVNTFLTLVRTIINGAIYIANKIINAINKLPGVEITKIDDLGEDSSLRLIMPCTNDSVYDEVANGHPIIDLIPSKRSSQTDIFGIPLTWYNGAVNTEEFYRTYHGKTYARVKRDLSVQGSAFEGDAAFQRTDFEESEFEKLIKDEEKFDGAIKFLRHSMIASDARKAYNALESCFIGSEDAPSVYTVCLDIQRKIVNGTTSGEDETCISARCARIAAKCTHDNVRKTARTTLNKKRANSVYDSLYTRPFRWALENGAWLVETTTCPLASPNLQLSATAEDDESSISLSTLLGIGTFVLDAATRIRYITTKYAMAYFECIESTEHRSRTRVGTEASSVESYVRCLEAPYVANEWIAPKTAQKTSDAFSAYLDSQRISSADGVCNVYMRKYGLLFDIQPSTTTIASILSLDQIMYRACLVMHAFGTRSTLATHIVASQGLEVLGKKKIVERTDSMWAPLPARTVGDYVNFMRAPVAMMRSAEFLSTSLLESLQTYSVRLGYAFSSIHSFAGSIRSHAQSAFDKTLKDNYAEITGLIHIVSLKADMYDEIIDPSNLVDRLRGEDDRGLVVPWKRMEVATRWHDDTRAEVARLMSYKRGQYVVDDTSFETLRIRSQRSRKRREADLHGRRRKRDDDDDVVLNVDEEFMRLVNGKVVENVRQNAEDTTKLIVPVTKPVTASYLRMSLRVERPRVVPQATSTFAPGNYSMSVSHTDVEMEIIPSRNQYRSDQARLDIRLVNPAGDRDTNRSALWSYTSFTRVDLETLSNALQRFIANTSNDASFAADIEDAERAHAMLTEMRGPVEEKLTAEKLEAQFEDMRKTGRLPDALRLQQERGDKLRDLGKSSLIGGALSAIARIVDRRTRVADLPPVQAISMLVSAVSNNDPQLLSDWLAGRLGYVNGLGFVPRMFYEEYMQAVRGSSEEHSQPVLRLAAQYAAHKDADPDSPFVQQLRTPVFTQRYDSMLRAQEARIQKREAAMTRLKVKFAQKMRRRHETAHVTFLKKHGHFDAEILHGDERNYHAIRLIAPHIHDHVWKRHGVNATLVRRAMRGDDRGHPLLRRAVTVTDSTNIVYTVLKWMDWVFQFVGVDDLFTNAFEEIKSAADRTFDLLAEWHFLDAFGDYFDSFVCNTPVDFVYDDGGAGSYGWGCVLMAYLPERLFKRLFGLWPTNAHTGDINWSPDAYVGGVPTGCADAPAPFFLPETYCPLSQQIPMYENFWKPKVCISTRAKVGANVHARLCIANEQLTPFPGPDGGSNYHNGRFYPPSMKQCPFCEYCEQDFNNCADEGYGTNPIRVVSTYTYHLGQIWTEALDPTNNLLTVAIFVGMVALLYAGTIFWPIAAWVVPLMIFYAVLEGTDTWFFTALLMLLLSVLFLPLAPIFFVYMLVLKIWFHNTATFQYIFDDPTLGQYALQIPYYDPMHAIGDLLNWLAGIEIPLVSMQVNEIVTLTNWSDEFYVFKYAPPTSFENLCSAFGIWSVVLTLACLVFLAIIAYAAFVTAVALLTLAVAIATAILNFLVYIGLFSLLTASMAIATSASDQARSYFVRMRRLFLAERAHQDTIEARVENIEAKTAPHPPKSPPPVTTTTTSSAFPEYDDALFARTLTRRRQTGVREDN